MDYHTGEDGFYWVEFSLTLFIQQHVVESQAHIVGVHLLKGGKND